MSLDNENVENAKAQMRKGLLEYCILLIISRGEIYASDIIKELQAADLLVVEGTLYPLLSRLKSEKLLEYNWVESQAGPPRKYYRLTEDGKKMLERLSESWSTLSKSIHHLAKQSHD